MKNFKKIIFVLLCVLTIFSFVACKSKNDDNKKDDNTDVVETIKAELESKTLQVDDEVSLLVYIEEDKSKDVDFTVEVDDDKICSYNNGKVKGLSVGKTVVKVLVDNEVIASLDVNVVARSDYELKVTASKNTIHMDEVITLDVELEGNKLANYDVFFKNGNCEYDASLKEIHPLKVGTEEVTIHVNYKGSDVTKTITITVLANIDPDAYVFETNVPEAMLLFQKIDSVTLREVNSNTEITNFKAKSLNDDVLDYMSDNSLEAIDFGEADLEFKFNFNGEDLTYTVHISITEELAIKVEYDKEIFVGEKASVKVIGMPDNIEITDYTLNTKDDSVTIENNEIIGASKGQATIYLRTIFHGTQLSATLIIKVKPEVELSLNTSIPSVLFISEEKEFEVFVKPTGEKLTDFTVTSSDENIIKYESGKLVAKNVGTSNITVITKSPKELSYTLKVDVKEFGELSVFVNENLHPNEMSKYELLIASSKVKPSKVEVSNDNLLFNDSFILAKSAGSAKLTLSYDYLGTTYKVEKEISIEDFHYEIEKIELAFLHFNQEVNSMTIADVVICSLSYQPKFIKDVDMYELVQYEISDPTLVRFVDQRSQSGYYPGGNIPAHIMVSIGLAGEVVIKASLKDNPNVYTTNTLNIVALNDYYVTVEDAVSGGSYIEYQVLNYDKLPGDVIHTTYSSGTNTKTPGLDVDGLGGLSQIIDNDLYYDQQVNVLSVPSNKDVKIIPWANLDGHKWTLTKVRSLIDNYEKHNPGYKVVAAINGDFFDINATKNLPYSTTGENISDGEFYKTSNIFGSGGGTVGFTNDGSSVSLIAGEDATRTNYMVLNIYDQDGNITNDEFKVLSWNSDSDTSVWYGTYNEEQNYVSKVVSKDDYHLFVISSAELALPNYDDDFYGKGVIDVVDPESYELQVGQFAIKTKDAKLISLLSSGVKIRCQFEYTGRFENVMSATGYNWMIYDENGMPEHRSHGNLGNRAPRTVIGMKEDGTIIMCVVDGRQGNKGMYGCDGYELAAMMKRFGCINAYNLDGGGSTTMVIRTKEGLKVLNSPSDGNERSDGNCILICVADPSYIVEKDLIGSSDATFKVTCGNNDFDEFDCYLKVNNSLFKVENGLAHVTGLYHNITYSYQVCYEKDGTLYDTLTTGTFTTSKGGFVFLNAILDTTDKDNFVLTVDAEDKEKASSIMEALVTMNDITTHLTDGKLVLQNQYLVIITIA